jgi:hypothetical protein
LLFAGHSGPERAAGGDSSDEIEPLYEIGLEKGDLVERIANAVF